MQRGSILSAAFLYGVCRAGHSNEMALKSASKSLWKGGLPSFVGFQYIPQHNWPHYFEWPFKHLVGIRDTALNWFYSCFFLDRSSPHTKIIWMGNGETVSMSTWQCEGPDFESRVRPSCAVFSCSPRARVGFVRGTPFCSHIPKTCTKG